jgi:acyl carrier protein
MGTKDQAQPAGDSGIILLRLVRDLVAELHPRQAPSRPISLDSTLERDLGIDSLGRVELIMRIERTFGASLPEQVFAAAETPRDLLQAVTGASRRGTVSAPRAVEPATGEIRGLPHEAETLPDALAWHVRAHPERTHIRLHQDDGEGEAITYRGLDQGARAVAAGLQQRGLLPDEAVAIMLPTGREYFFSFFGILLAGGIPVPIYPPVRFSQIEEHLRRQRKILRNSRSVVLITVPEAKPLARLLRSQVESLRSVDTPEELTADPGACAPPPRTAGDIAFLQYTSGSTGNPKGVVLTHANLLANIRADGEGIRAGPDDVFVSWLPLYHDMGLIGAWLGSLYFAVQLVIMSPLAFLSRPRRWLWAIHHHRGTLSAAPNFAYELCLSRISDEDLQGLDLSSWRLAFNGAEAVSPETVVRFGERFARYGFEPSHMFPVYGLAECSVGLAFPPLGRGPIIDRIRREPFMRAGRAEPAEDADASALRFVACGQPLPRHEIRIVDEADRELPERREGRLQFRGPSATRGYYRNPEATRALFHGDWLDSGDLAYAAGGDVYVTGRTKDVIIRGGRNVYPQELEEAVGEMPGVRKGRVVVFGAAEAKTGTERLVVLAETRERDEGRREALRERISAAAADLAGLPPDEVVLAPSGSVLKTSSGKLRRAATRELYERGRLGRPRRAVWWQLTRLALMGLGPALRRWLYAAGGLAYSVYAWALFRLLAAVAAASLLTLPVLSWRWAVIRRTARLLATTTATPFTVEGVQNVPRDGRCVLVANHASYLDVYVLVAALPGPFSFVAKAELAASPILRLFLRRIRTEFVDRFDKVQGVADAGRLVQAAGQGRTLLFFPEGTFTRMPGLLPFHMGAFLTAVDARVPVVPVVIRGTRSILRADSSLPRRGAIAVRVGKPLQPEAPDSEAAEPWPAAVRLRDAARAYVLKHSGEPDLAHEKIVPQLPQ